MLATCWLAFGLAALVCAPLATWLAARKGRHPDEGFTLGLMLGPCGVLIEGLLPRRSVERFPTRPDDTPLPFVAFMLGMLIFGLGSAGLAVLFA